MTLANSHPVSRASLLAALALLGSLGIATASLGSTGGHRTTCNHSPARHTPRAHTERKRRATACKTRGHIGRARAISRHTRGPGTGVPAKPLPPAPAPETPPALDPSPSPNSIYWGAWITNSAGEAPWSMAAAASFERLAGKPVSLINWSSPFDSPDCNGYCGFQESDFNAVRNHGSIPFFSWNPGPGDGEFTDASVAAGAQDSYIAAWARAAKEWGHPFFLRFAWEMNGPWFPWGVGNGGTTAADYVAMWRHVHDISTSAGASNVTWVWCPNIDPYGQRTPMASVYPGDAYVDWTCLDGYNGDNPWRSFSDLFKTSYETLTGTLAPSKPMIVGETASTETGGSKVQWIADMLQELPTAFPKIRGLLWLDKVESGPGSHSDWPIESSTAASNAFAAGIQAPTYAGNDYSSTETSPIPPPKPVP